MEAVEQRLYARIRLDIDHDKRIAIAGEEFAYAQGSGAVMRSQHHDFSMAGIDQAHAPQDKGAHEHFAEFCIELHDAAQMFLTDCQHLAALAHADANEPRYAAQRTHLSREVAGKQYGYKFFATYPGPGRFQTARQHDQQILMLLSRFDQHLPGRSDQTPAVPLESRKLCGAEFGKHLFPAFLVEVIRHLLIFLLESVLFGRS